MEHPLSSPERGPLNTKTYLERKKRKRTKSNVESDSDSSSTSRPAHSLMKSSRKSDTEAPANRRPKQVDVSLPGPSPKRARQSSDEESTASGVQRVSHIRSASSVGSQQDLQKNSSSSHKKPESVSAPLRKSKSRAKPAAGSENDCIYSPDSGTKREPTLGSLRKPKSKAKSVTGDDELDDSVSIADSSISTTRIRRNETERMEYFKNQPECGKLDTHSAECIRCGKSVNLGRKQTYSVRPWEIHRARCDLKPAQVVPGMPDSKPASGVSEAPISSPEAPSSTKPTPARRPTEAERKEFLEADKQIQDLEKHRALCRKCQNWVVLSEAHPYATGNWVKHKSRCSVAVPSNRVAAAKRKLLLVNDKQVKSFAVRQVECCFCGAAVQLEGEGDYNLSKWDEHKSRCTKTVPLAKGDPMNSVPFPSRFSVPPSTISTEDTVVADAVNPPSPQGTKRSREDSEAVPDEDARPSARQRRSSYLPGQIEPPSTVMGWFMLPFHSFVRGFKESWKDKS